MNYLEAVWDYVRSKFVILHFFIVIQLFHR